MFNKRFQDNMESKTYVFGNEGSTSNNGMLGLLAPLLQKQGVDPNVLLAMKVNNGFGGNIVTGKQIGRASCRERVSSPV